MDDGHGPLLADPVHSADGLVLEGGILARIHEDDVVGDRQVDADGAGPDRNEEDRDSRVALELELEAVVKE